MKRITNTYKEPIVISLLVKTPGKVVSDRTQENLLVGKHKDVKDDAISPELMFMEKKERVSIKDIDVEPTMEPSGIVEVEVVEKPPPKDEPAEDEEIKKLEKELLREQDPQED